MEPVMSGSRSAGKGWLFISILGLLVALFGLYVVFVPVDVSDFERETGIEWDSFGQESSDVAAYLEREARLLGVTAMAMGGLAAGLAGTLVRRGDRTAWLLLWVLPVALALYAVVFFASSAEALGGFYVGGAVIAVAATWAARPRR